MIAWIPSIFEVSLMVVTDQFIHTRVLHIGSRTKGELSVVYGLNHIQKRSSLWRSIYGISDANRDPWIVGGDFNNILLVEERIGAPVITSEFQDFKNCLGYCGLSDMKFNGCFYTWNNNQDGGDRVFCKIDRVLCTEKWFELFPDAITDFLPEGLFDHSTAIVSMTSCSHKGKAPFRYYNWWTYTEGFAEKIFDCWKIPIQGTSMYRLVMKLKMLKKIPRSIGKNNHPNLEKDDREAELHMKQCPKEMNDNPLDVSVREKEKQAAAQYKSVHDGYMSHLKQREKAHWLKEGDVNSSFFHNSISQGRVKNNIYEIKSMNGMVMNNPQQVSQVFIEYYENLLGSNIPTHIHVNNDIVRKGKVISLVQRANICKPISSLEIKEAMQGIGGDKAPGPDGFSSQFYKDNWDIVKDDVNDAI